MKPNPISATIDFDKNGIQHGFLQLPHSRDDSAWGSILIPICVVQNGAGPTALLTGANHGDEYEGPVALQHLAYTLDPAQISGRVIIIPAFNYPAFRAAKRTSPIDSGNLNRLFPGKPDGTITEKIADYFQCTLIPMSDYVLDIHAGGKTLDFLPFAAAHILDDKQQQANCIAAMTAFNAPYSMMMLELDSVGLYDTAVEAQGKIFVSTELGGGGSSTATSNAIAKRGVRNFLIHAGILKGELTTTKSIMLDMPDNDCFVFSAGDGLIEFMKNLADPVIKGELIARVWPTDKTGAKPSEYHAKRDGILSSRHFPGLIQSGDCLAVVATPIE